jgi:hypothetical protein
MAQPFSDQSVQAAVNILAVSGVGTFERPDSAAAMVPVSEPASPLVLLLDQVRAMALEASVGGGFEGAELDSMVETEADLAAPSYILAGYVAAADTDGSRIAQKVMGATDWDAEDWEAAPTLLYPQLVMALFTADVTREQAADAAATLRSPGLLAAIGPVPEPDVAEPPQQGTRVAQSGLCSSVSAFISGALHSVFNALRLGEQRRGASLIFARIWNFVVSVLESVVTAIVRTFEQKVLNAIGRVAATVGAISMIISAIRPWTMTVKAVPNPTEKGIVGIRPVEQGQVVAQVQLGGLTEWPAWAVDCANRANRPLPSLKPEGAPVTWETLGQAPPDLVQEGIRREAMDTNGAAQLDFTTLVDSVEDPYQTLPGTVFARVSFERPGIRELANIAENELWSEIPSVVVGPLRTYLGPTMDNIKNKFVRLLSVAASGPSTVLYHVSNEEPNACKIGDGPATAVRGGLPANAGGTMVAQGGSGDCAMSNGDPHIVTVNGGRYDLQSAGEFVLLRSTDGSFEIQSRQAPFADSPGVSINTAVAMRVGNQRFGIYLEGGGSSFRTMIDGQQVELSGPMEVGGGRVVPNGSTSIDIEFPNGAWASAINLGFYGINFLFSPTTDLRDAGMGVMGPIGEGNWLPNLPDGTSITRPADRHERYVQLYERFADAWRVQQASSLFDYEPGTTTDTFTVRPYPREEDMFEFEDILELLLQFAEAACGDVTDPTLNEQCLFDVAVTEDEGFAEAYETTFSVVAPDGSLPDSTVRIRFANFFSSATGPSAIDVYRDSGQTDASGSPVKVLLATVPYGEVSEWVDPGRVEGPFGFTTFFDIYPAGQTTGSVGVSTTSGPHMSTLVVVGTTSYEDGTTSISTNHIPEREPEQNSDFNWVPAEGMASIASNMGGLAIAPGADLPQFFVGVDGECVLSADFPFLEDPRPIPQAGFERLDIAPGQHAVTIHQGNADGTIAACDQPLGGAQTFDFEADRRVHLIVYGNSVSDAQFLLLPYEY